MMETENAFINCNVEKMVAFFFFNFQVENIRFPQDQGRAKGFGYAEFFDIDQLKNALALNGEV